MTLTLEMTLTFDVVMGWSSVHNSLMTRDKVTHKYLECYLKQKTYFFILWLS